MDWREVITHAVYVPRGQLATWHINHMTKILRVMIHYHLNIQIFNTLSMLQGGPSP
jgi:hypothetical protein